MEIVLRFQSHEEMVEYFNDHIKSKEVVHLEPTYMPEDEPVVEPKPLDKPLVDEPEEKEEPVTVVVQDETLKDIDFDMEIKNNIDRIRGLSGEVLDKVKHRLVDMGVKKLSAMPDDVKPEFLEYLQETV